MRRSPSVHNKAAQVTTATDKLPNILYRYRSLDGNGMARLGEIVSQRKIYFSNPAAFNDPFDCRPVFSLDGTEQEQFQYFYGIYQRKAPHLSKSECRTEIRKLLGSPKSPVHPEAIRGFADHYHQHIAGSVGLLCLTESPDDILMWSHYAASHRGVCLGFRAESTSFNTALKVRYEPSRPVINPIFQNPDEMLERALLTKAKHWEYENEWRLIRYKAGAGVYSFHTKALAEIILGSQIGEAEATEVRKMALSSKSRPNIRRAVLCQDTFKIRLLDE